jgi:hypothetical protein
MKILEKYVLGSFTGFDWLNFESLTDSDGFKFEVYFEETDDLVSQSISYFYLLFGNVQSEILIQDFKPGCKWGDFCLDTWNFHEDTYDYSADNKKEPTASYLAMIGNSGIEPEYIGFCQCLDWDKFLQVTLQCVMEHVAVYSMNFYIPSKRIMFYFHHTGSIGVYYKELNEAIKDIIKKVKERGLEIENTNDDRLAALFESIKLNKRSG